MHHELLLHSWLALVGIGPEACRHNGETGQNGPRRCHPPHTTGPMTAPGKISVRGTADHCCSRASTYSGLCLSGARGVLLIFAFSPPRPWRGWATGARSAVARVDSATAAVRYCGQTPDTRHTHTRTRTTASSELLRGATTQQACVVKQPKTSEARALHAADVGDLGQGRPATTHESGGLACKLPSRRANRLGAAWRRGQRAR